MVLSLVTSWSTCPKRCGTIVRDFVNSNETSTGVWSLYSRELSLVDVEVDEGCRGSLLSLEPGFVIGQICGYVSVDQS
jgi:hypothetical protein